jgi:hypothetical protein
MAENRMEFYRDAEGDDALPYTMLFARGGRGDVRKRQKPRDGTTLATRIRNMKGIAARYRYAARFA